MRASLTAIVPLLAAAACVTDREPAVPMPARVDVAAPRAPCLVVFLPGRRDSPGAFARHGFVKFAREAGVAAEFVEADAHYGYYRTNTLVERLAADVIRPRLSRTRRVWLVGISMGGLGAILYAKEHPEGVRGLLLLAPYLGDEATAREVAAAGLARWDDDSGGVDWSRELWTWLREHARTDVPAMYVGYGTKDDLAPADRALAGALPPGHAFTVAGRHTWHAWDRLWKDFVASGVLQRDCAAE